LQKRTIDKKTKKTMKNLFVTLAAVACIAVLSHSAPVLAQTAFHGNEESRRLVDEGNELLAKGNATEAFARFQAAAKADSKVSSPLSAAANLLFVLSRNADAQHAQEYRQQAERYARAALAIEPKDPQALEVLRQLTRRTSTVLHQPNASAMAALNDADRLFAARNYEAALAGFTDAQRLDPQWAVPWIYAGDCQFALGRVVEAEALYRKGTQIEPLHPQGWRFLADALAKQGKRDEAIAALFGALAAQPDYMPAWENLSDLSVMAGKPLRALRFQPQAAVEVDKDTGKHNVMLNASVSQASDKGGQNVDLAVWLTYGMSRIPAKASETGPRELSAFQTEFHALDTALQVAEEALTKGDRKLADAQLQILLELRRHNMLDAAIFMLMYREDYRPEFEQWKREHPDAIATLVREYRLRP
jgi:tetratricopeptide (TPR) repeat protein